jgi:riboflavin kinase/FMN adenylyltransferase
MCYENRKVHRHFLISLIVKSLLRLVIILGVIDNVKLPVELSGTITHYAGNGRLLGYPTANITTQSNLSDGVYFGYADLQKFHHWPCLIFIGTPTTIGDTGRRIEAHLLDIPDTDYYKLSLQLKILYFYRKTETFTTVEDLLGVMRTDEINAREWFSREH